MKILFLDTETTGLDEKTNRVVEITGHLYDTERKDGYEDTPVDAFRVSLNYHNYDKRPISLGALAVNGRTVDSINDWDGEGNVDFDTGMARFVDWLIKIKREHKEFAVAGHNVHFDIRFLNQALKDAGFVDLEQVIGHRYIDTASIAMFLKDLGIISSEKTGTEALAKEFNYTPPPHNTTADVEFTYQLYRKLKSLVTRATA